MRPTRQDLAKLSLEEKRQLLARLAEEKKGRPRCLPMSFSQQRLWFLDQLSPDNPFYNVEANLELSGSVDARALARAINEIVRRHEVLRTTFREIDGQPVQIVAPELNIDLPVIDLRSLPATERDREKERLVVENARWLYDLASGPLIRTTLLQLSANESLFLLGMHHIVADGWSMGVFSGELKELYSSYLTGRPARLPELAIQYGDYAAWQRRWLTGEVRERQLRYWRRQLADLPTMDLPTDRPRPAMQSYRGSFHTFEVPPYLADALRQLSREADCTLFMTLLAAFKLILHRWSGQQEVVVGTYIANRTRAETEHLIGFFLNTLVLRTSLAGAPTFRVLLSRVREVALGAYEHQDFPFEALVDELQPERDLSRNPLFQVSFQVSNVPTQSPAEISRDNVSFKRATSIFDLAFLIFETRDGLVGHFEYSTDLFEAATIERLGAQFELVLEAIARDPDVGIGDLSLIPPQEEQLLLFDWNATAKELAWERGLRQRLAEQVEKRGDAVAFHYGGESITFGELDGRAKRLAARLAGCGVGRQDVVGICVERSITAVVSILGVLEAGAAWMPLDPSLPPRRMAYMLAEAGARLAIVSARTAGTLPALDVDTLELAEGGVVGDGKTAPVTPSSPQPESLAYVIYTSGSTGQPKGVAATHRQVLNRLEWMWGEHPFAAGEVAVMKTALSFVDSVWEVFGALLQGRPTLILPDSVVRDPYALVKALAEYRVSRIWLVPSLLWALLDSFPDLRRRLPDLEFWVTTGEALTGELLRRFRAAMPGAKLFNLYGTSEVWDVSWCQVAGDDITTEVVTIGKPIQNVRTYVLDEYRHPVPIGVPGELYVAGFAVARGYVGRPELTDTAFVDWSLPNGEVERLYQTGDRVRYRLDGELEFLGRLDHQVKIRGFRVEPLEIEAALSAYPDLEAVAVAARDNGAGDHRIYAWYLPREGRTPGHNELRDFLRESLPDYMIPSAFIPLDELPLTDSAKVDRKALRLPEQPQRGSDAPLVAPSNAVEAVLAEIWSEVLDLNAVGVRDDFFADLGGHSLLATRLISRVRDRFEVEIPIRAIFEYPTVSLFSTHLLGDARSQDQIRARAEALTVAGASAEAGGAGERPMIPRLSRREFREPDDEAEGRSADRS